jgi:two-component system response regulator YesN
MRRIMIVDDEIMVRFGMRAIIDWEKQGYEVVGEAENGLEAYEKIEQLQPDLIFTDLVMDKMDGFELIEKCKADYPKIQFVILSNYNDFDNVRRAMQLGALDYIFKLTVTKEDVLKVLDLVEKKMGESKENDLSDIVRKNRHAIRSTLIKRLVEKGYVNFDDLVKEFEIIGVELPVNRPYFVFMVGIDNYRKEVLEGKLTGVELLKFSMENMITEILEERFKVFGFNYDTEDLLFIVTWDSELDGSQIHTELENRFSVMYEYIKRYFDVSITAVYSKEYNNLKDISRAVDECKSILRKRLPHECGKLHDSNDSMRSEIKEIKEYINLHLNENLTIELAAKETNMSQSYFSHVFKENMKMGFIDYVNRTRIMRACELLARQDMKINEVADMVGIENYNYFSILFKKVMGVSPNAYKKSISENLELQQKETEE